MINESTPLGLPKILKELENKGTVRILHRKPGRAYDFGQLVPLLFKEGLPDTLVKNLDSKTTEALFQSEKEETKSVWSSIRSYFHRKEGRTG